LSPRIIVLALAAVVGGVVVLRRLVAYVKAPE
jgi:hypothetical protein